MNVRDAWQKSQGGFRLDWTPAGDLVTLQGDVYTGSEDELNTPDEAIIGHNLLTRWNHAFSEASSLQVQAYYDYSKTSIPNVGFDELNTYDLDVQHAFAWGSHQSIVWGGGIRNEVDNFPTVLSSTQVLTFLPPRRTLDYSNAFLQDTISLSRTLNLIVGAKYEHARLRLAPAASRCLTLPASPGRYPTAISCGRPYPGQCARPRDSTGICSRCWVPSCTFEAGTFKMKG